MLVAPLGEDENPFSRDKVIAKDMSLAAPVYGEKAQEIMQTVHAIESHQVEELMALIS
jgi:2-methylcitrate dehydratase PrpD